MDHWSQCVGSRYRKVISLPFPSMTAASLHTVGHGCRVPLRVESGGKTVKRVAVENPLSRGGHTHTHTHTCIASYCRNCRPVSPILFHKRRCKHQFVCLPKGWSLTQPSPRYPCWVRPLLSHHSPPGAGARRKACSSGAVTDFTAVKMGTSLDRPPVLRT